MHKMFNKLTFIFKYILADEVNSFEIKITKSILKLIKLKNMAFFSKNNIKKQNII